MKLLTYFSTTLLVTSLLSASDAVLPNDKQYYKFNENNIEIIYPEEHLEFAKDVARVEADIHKNYELFYDWKLDETLYVGLISSNMQMANGFSTQAPNNRQINYLGGTQIVDYFSTTSWLNTLLYHETSHNYQLNVKGSIVSRALHSVFGNGGYAGEISIFIPIYITPNIFINSFMLEGNSVLNESWHGNGGRLYSGRFKVGTILQAASGNIVAGDVYNQKIGFPNMGEIHYIQGGFYNLYLAEKYGLKKVNSFFKYNSEQFIWPHFTNVAMKRAIGVDFEDSLRSFAIEYASMAKHLKFASGKPIANSQFFSAFSNNSDEIFFLTNESGVRAPELLILNKKTKDINKERGSWLSGKVIKSGDDYYTQGSYKTSLSKINQALFDSEAIMKEGTGSKMIQGYLSDGKKVYFDVVSSFDQPQLYVGDEFYAQVNSSVIIDKDDNLYYFVQKGKTRTLYKNKTPLYSYQGFYGIVSDVDSKGIVYFVANSKYGSTLYRFDNNKVTQAHEADNIIAARLINDDEVLVAAISEKDYYYVINGLKSIDKEPYETKLFFEDKNYYGAYKESEIKKEDYAHLDLSDPYTPLFDMHYSGTYIYADGFNNQLSINFADPLTQNSLSFVAFEDTLDVKFAGVSYANSQNLLQYSMFGYKVVDSGELDDARNEGVILNANLPLYTHGRKSAFISASYYQDYELKDRNILSFVATMYDYSMFGISMYANYLNMLSLYGSYESDNKIYGTKYSLKHDLPYEFYIGLEAKYSTSKSDTKGVKVEEYIYDEINDPSTISMPSLDVSYYMKSVAYVDVSLKKVFNLSSYWFTFPISLQREAIYTKYRHYRLEDTSSNIYNVNEITAGVTLATVFLNNVSLPISIEYIHNDAEFIENKTKTRVFIDVNF